MTRSISKLGLDLIKKYEGLRLNAYLCPASVPTIGFGNTRYPNGKKVKMGDVLANESEATSLLLASITPFEEAINRHLTNLNQCQFDALVSFCYNVGTGAFVKSTLLKKAKVNPNDPSILDEFLKWNKGGGKVLPGLITRRNDEAKLYFSLCK
jgi:lysozyme